MSKAQLSLEYIVKMIIILVVIMVTITLIIKFKSNIQVAVKNLFGKDQEQLNFPQIIEKKSFSLGEISAYIESCYSTMTSLPEDEQKNIICYLLESEDGFSITKEDLENIISNDIKDSKWYDQDYDEWVILLQGEAVLEFETYQKKLFKGDYLFIKSHEKHRIVSTSKDALWLVIYMNQNL